MTVQVTIIGLGQLGASFGLALGEYKDQITRFGVDTDPVQAQKAQKMGAVEKVHPRYSDAVKDADVVILAVPLDEVEDTVKSIAPDLREGSVILDTSPLKVAVFELIKTLLPEDRYFVSFMPTLNPAYLHETETGTDSAHVDLFKNGLVVTACPPNTHADAVRLADDLAHLIGARPFYVDPYESDGLMAAVDLLPRLTSAALLNALSNQPGWREAEKLTGRAFYSSTVTLLQEDSSKPDVLYIYNRENVVRVLDNLIASLTSIRDAIAEGNSESLAKLLKKMHSLRDEWWKQRQLGNWEKKVEQPEIPSAGERFGRLFGIRPRKGKKND